MTWSYYSVIPAFNTPSPSLVQQDNINIIYLNRSWSGVYGLLVCWQPPPSSSQLQHPVKMRNMEDLPIEIVLKIAEQLSTKDLVACSAISYGWRATFNKDLLWISRYNRATIKYLAQTDCIVKPGFKDPPVQDGRLGPVCPERLNVMREIHLWNNWRSEKCEWAQLQISSRGLSSFNFCTFYEDDFIISFCDDQLTIFDVRSEPVSYFSANPCLSLPRVSVSFCTYSRDRLILVQWMYVLVFKINLMSQNWMPEHMFCFEDDKEIDILNASSIDSEERIMHLTHLSCFVAADYFFGINNLCKNIMHIWNFKDGVKNGAPTLNEAWSFLHVKPPITQQPTIDDVLVIVKKGPLRFQALIYSLNDHAFYPFHFDNPKHCALNGQLALIWTTSDCCKVYNFRTGQLLREVNYPFMRSALSCDIFNNKLISDVNGILYVFDLTTGHIKNILDIGCEVKELKILADRFILFKVPYLNDGRLRDTVRWKPGCPAREVWEIAEPPRRTSLDLGINHRDIVKVNSSCTKLILKKDNNNIFVVNFW